MFWISYQRRPEGALCMSNASETVSVLLQTLIQNTCGYSLRLVVVFLFATLFLSTGIMYPNKSFYILLCTFQHCIVYVWLRNEDGKRWEGIPRWDWAGTVQVTACKLWRKVQSPHIVRALGRVTNFSNSCSSIMMPAGLPEYVFIPLSGLLSCLGDKQCHWDDGSNQPGFLARGKHHIDMAVLLPEPDEAKNKMAASPRG